VAFFASAAQMIVWHQILRSIQVIKREERKDGKEGGGREGSGEQGEREGM